MLRTVNETKCIGCGTCQKVCALDLFRLQPDQAQVSPCTYACPIHNDMRKIHYLLQMGEIEKASAMLDASNPLASITGRICPHPCESECARGEVDSPVNISAIEQYLGDYALESIAVPVPRQHVGAVAIIGSGPAGLSCAYFLANKGFSVTVYECSAEAGGMLRYAIPIYRLPREILNRFIKRLEDMGVTIKCNNRIDSIDTLLNNGFRAVFLAPGAGKSKKLNIPGLDENNNVHYGLEFLRNVRTGRISSMPATVLIIGGGNVAIDAAQSAKKLGAKKVTVVTLEEENRLPAHRHNVNSALTDGIEFIYSWGVQSITAQEDDRPFTLHASRCISVFDSANTFSPQYDHNTKRDFTADALILAVGQESELSFVPDHLLESGRLIRVTSGTRQTASSCIFAAGDAVDGPASIAQAIGGAKKAASAIESLLGGFELEGWTEKEFEPVRDLASPKSVKQMRRHEKQTRQSHDRFAELYTGFDLVDTLTEAERCMTCGAKALAAHMDDCMTCFACELDCPAEAIFVHPFKEVLPRAFEPDSNSSNTGPAVGNSGQPLYAEITGAKIGGHNE